ncbi:MAG TPA: SPFH domain-containing protein [Vicinamibacterales bacterium]|nr:SPFH domain-containing protein [Vicinamibacterales bacterium]
MTNAQLWTTLSIFPGAPIAALALVVVVVLLFYRAVARLFGVVIVPEDSVGIVNKRYVVVGQHRTLPAGAIIALKGEAGLQADALAPGLHFGLWPWQYIVTLQKFITINQDTIGIVEARDGHPLTDGRVLARRVNCNSFQDARAFLEGGGERGPQMTVIPPGTYRINTALFTVQNVKVLDIPDNMLGIVTTKEGHPLPAGEIASQPVDGHSSFQDAQAFVDAGGGKGLQEQVILAGRYFINPRFATVEIKETTIVPIANVGVVIAYVGREGKDVTGEGFKHGNLVNRGEKGVWVEPMDPGKYPINPYTHRVELVPTANVVLNWATGKTEAHNLDKNLSTITVRSSDGFTFNLDVSQIIHIPRTDAPKVIARFGSIVNLVTQVLEPTIGNYFRNAAQGSDVIDFLRTRRERQEDAKKQISAALADYNVVAVDTLIGDITPPEALMTTLTDRKLAEQEKVTFDTQRLAEETRKELQQATAMADTQASVVAAERQVQIQAFQASAAVKTAEGQAASRKLVADGEAYATRATGNADAEKTKAVGTAEADVIKLKIASMDSGNYAGIEISRALAASGFKLVPDVVVSGGGGTADTGSSLVSVLLANLIRDGRGKRSD